MAYINAFARKSLIFIIRTYQYAFSLLFGACCRFEPSCSSYAVQAVNKYGCFRGIQLTVGRLLRCHPWHAGGYDPVR